MSTKYEYFINDDNEILGCNCCSMEAPLHVDKTVTERSGINNSETVYLCELCHCSFIGNTYLWPSQYSNIDLHKSIAQVGNIILDNVTDRQARAKSRNILNKG